MIKITGIGNLTKDPELRTTATGVSVCTFTIASNRRKGKEKVTDYLNCVAWRELGENVAKYMSKGKKLGVSGDFSTRSYEDSHGNKRYVTECVCSEVEFLSPMGEKPNMDDRDREPADMEPYDATDDPF